MLVMEPIARKRLAGGALALRNLIGVMGEYQVNAAGVDIKRMPQVFHRHGTALNMPARPSLSKLGLPEYDAVFPAPCLPQGKVTGLFFLVFILLDPGTDRKLTLLQQRQMSVIPEFRNRVIDAAVIALVGDFLFEQLLDQCNHLRDMLGGCRTYLGMLDVQRIDILEKGFPVAVGIFLQGDFFLLGALDGLVIHVRQVHDLFDRIPLVPKIASKNILADIGPEIADVRKIVDRRAACIHAYLLPFQRLEGFFLPSEGVEELQRHNHLSCTGRLYSFWWKGGAGI